jgi:hypothetical protein
MAQGIRVGIIAPEITECTFLALSSPAPLFSCDAGTVPPLAACDRVGVVRQKLGFSFVRQDLVQGMDSA